MIDRTHPSATTPPGRDLFSGSVMGCGGGRGRGEQHPCQVERGCLLGWERLEAPPPRAGRRTTLHLSRRGHGRGGTLTASYADAAMFDAIATVIDAQAALRTAEDTRPPAQRQAEALADACGFVLDHGELPQTGGRRPHLTVLIRLDELEQRAGRATPRRRPGHPRHPRRPRRWGRLLLPDDVSRVRSRRSIRPGRFDPIAARAAVFQA
jgi:hypothetical protein